MSKHIYGLDPSFNNTGVAIFNGEGKCLDYCFIDSHKADNHIKRAIEIKKGLIEVFNKYPPEVVYIEDISYGSLQNYSKQMSYLTYGLCELCEALSIDWRLISIGSVKKLATGNGRADKKGMIESLPDFVLEELQSRFKKSRWEHIADAYWVAVFGMSNGDA